MVMAKTSANSFLKGWSQLLNFSPQEGLKPTTSVFISKTYGKSTHISAQLFGDNKTINWCFIHQLKRQSLVSLRIYSLRNQTLVSLCIYTFYLAVLLIYNYNPFRARNCLFYNTLLVYSAPELVPYYFVIGYWMLSQITYHNCLITNLFTALSYIVQRKPIEIGLFFKPSFFTVPPSE